VRVLVTGGAGFIGSHTVDALLAKGHSARVFDNFGEPGHNGGYSRELQRDVHLVTGDVRDKHTWERALQGVEVVFHFAAYQGYMPDFSTFFHVNSAGTALLYEVAVEQRLPLRRVIIASSQAVYGEGRYRCVTPTCSTAVLERDQFPSIRSEAQLAHGTWDHVCPECGQVLRPQPTDEQAVNPQNQYAISKYTQELIALSLGKRYGIPTTVARYSITQGPRQSSHNAYSGVCRIFCMSYLSGRPARIYEDGQQVRDFVNIEDVVPANMLLMEHPGAVGEVFNVGGGRAYTVREFAEIVRRVVGANAPPETRGEYRFGDTRHAVSDIRKLQALGWRPRYTPEKSVADYVAWVRTTAGLEGVLDQAQRTMVALGVLRRTASGRSAP
jgi:dTDP-L-rhamnose 4-epimerase